MAHWLEVQKLYWITSIGVVQVITELRRRGETFPCAYHLTQPGKSTTFPANLKDFFQHVERIDRLRIRRKP